MTNQEAIIAGVEKWMDSSKEVVLKCLQTGSERATRAGAEVIALAISARIGQFLEENRAEIITSIAGQLAVATLNMRTPPQGG
jgi:O-acetyl-ADP-ribose deacetylase (regulator of RNase III)